MIYRNFLTSYLSDSTNGFETPLNVAMTTEAFNPSSEIHPDQACLWADDIDDLSTPELHLLSTLALPADKVNLVDTTPLPPPEKSHTVSVTMPFIKHRQTAASATQPAVAAPLPATMLSLSEIVFNKKHTLAAFHYSYVCGEQCGHGETVIFELQNGAWKLAKTGCSKWVV